MEEPPPKPKKKKKKKKKSKKRKGKGKRRNEDYPFEGFSDYSNDSDYEWESDTNSEFSEFYSNAYDEYEHHYNVFEDPENDRKRYKKDGPPQAMMVPKGQGPLVPY